MSPPIGQLYSVIIDECRICLNKQKIMENINEDCMDLPYESTNGIAGRMAMSGGEPHDHHRLRGHITEALGNPPTNFVVKHSGAARILR